VSHEEPHQRHEPSEGSGRNGGPNGQRARIVALPVFAGHRKHRFDEHSRSSVRIARTGKNVVISASKCRQIEALRHQDKVLLLSTIHILDIKK
jgi:hypothetical protein